MKNILLLPIILLGFSSCRQTSQQESAIRIVETQSVPVFSDPTGAQVVVDDVEMGITPISLTLMKNRDHTVIVRKEGHVPQTISLTSKTDGDGVSCHLIPAVIDVVLEVRS